MGDIAIKVENLSKLYKIGARQQGYKTLRESIMGTLTSPFRHFTKDRECRIQNPESDTIWALKDVSFEVKRGQVVGIIGRNGAGKTTLLKILSRITEPTRGRAEIHGLVGSLLEVGTGFHPELTGRENIYLNGAILGMRRAEIQRKFDEVVSFAEIERFMDTPVKRYSSGMYVRLAFAVAAHLEPEILLVDEVLAVGDVAFQKKCIGKMGAVAGEGRTVLFVSHNMGAVNRLCERCVLLDDGQISMIDSTELVISKYLSSGEEGSSLVQVNAGKPDTAVIYEVGIINADGEFTCDLEANRDFFVWIRFVLKRKIEGSQIAVRVSSVADGAIVFVTTNTDAGPLEETFLMPGEYRARVRIPGNFLNVGSYSINVRIWGTKGGQRVSHAFAADALTFRLLETGTVASKLSDRRRGFVIPVLEWEFL